MPKDVGRTVEEIREHSVPGILPGSQKSANQIRAFELGRKNTLIPSLPFKVTKRDRNL